MKIGITIPIIRSNPSTNGNWNIIKGMLNSIEILIGEACIAKSQSSCGLPYLINAFFAIILLTID